jgi:hypothetical protein
MTVTTLQLPPGVVRGANPDDAPGRWFECNLVRWRDGIMEPVGGWQRMTETPLKGVPRTLVEWRNNENRLRYLVGTDQALYAEDEGKWADITPVGFVPFDIATTTGGYGSANYGTGLYGGQADGPTALIADRPMWSFANWGEDMLAVASTTGELLYYKQGIPSVAPTVVASAPKQNRAVVATAERHAMLLGIGGDKRDIGWSSREDYTDFDFASTTNTAGRIPLRAETPIINGVNVREGVLIFTETEAHLARYVGIPYIYGAEILGSANLFAPQAFAEFDGKCAWWDWAGFMLYDGGAIRPLACPLNDYVFSDINKTLAPRVSFAFILGSFNEIWWHYPSADSSECDRFIVWNYTENWWSMGKLARSAGYRAGAGQHPTLASPDGHLYRHESGWDYDTFDCAGGVFIASGTLNVGEGEQSMHINQLIPSNGKRYDLTKYTLFTRMTPGQAEVVSGPYLARADGYVDTRAQGRDVRLRICANGPGDWSIGRIRMNIHAGGRR